MDGKADTTGRTMEVARIEKERGSDTIVQPRELVEVRYARGVSLSLSARKVFALMMHQAAGDAWRDQEHRIAKRMLRGSHNSNDRLTETIDELMGIFFAMPDKVDGDHGRRTFQMIEETFEGGEQGWLIYRFTRRARDLLKDSEAYALLHRATVLAFDSKYALELYQLGALLYRRDVPIWRGDVETLRAKLGVPEGAYSSFADLRRFVLDAATAEINQLVPQFSVAWDVAKRRGRKVIEVAITFRRKPPIAAVAAEEENERHRAGRRARRDGTAETIMDPSAIIAATAANLGVSDVLRWPADDQVTEFGATELHAIGVTYGGGHAVQRLADQYARVRADKRRQLRGDALREDWTTWVRGCAEKWSKP
ncbi:MAG TPA: replication initiation protein [Sphingobium sp.]